MRFFASARIPRTGIRLGVITGPFGHHTGHTCPACGVAVHTNRFLDWCVYLTVGLWVAHYLFR
jgi:hypothetical protein